MCTRIKCQRCSTGLTECRIIFNLANRVLLVCPKCSSLYVPWYDWDNPMLVTYLGEYGNATIGSERSICGRKHYKEFIRNQNTFIEESGWK